MANLNNLKTFSVEAIKYIEKELTSLSRKIDEINHKLDNNYLTVKEFAIIEKNYDRRIKTLDERVSDVEDEGRSSKARFIQTTIGFIVSLVLSAIAFYVFR